jgi:3'-phosphoadenosine 5'-phosphosulfate sulfotransferase (PAPS reductase)/FAD synthetase
MANHTIKPQIAVWFSCGAASAVAAKLTLEKYSHTHKIKVVNNPIKEEHPDNQRFLKDVEQWLGVDIETAINPKYPSASCVDVWAKRRYMSGIAGAPCTLELKKRARQAWEKDNPCEHLVLGFTLEEKDRADRFRLTERDSLIAILIAERISKADCFTILRNAGIKLPEIYGLGYPNANCIGCVKATSPTYWDHVRKTHPGQFKERAEQSRDIGAKLVRYQGKRIYLDELPEGAKGGTMKGLDFECGLFCEERDW